MPCVRRLRTTTCDSSGSTTLQARPAPNSVQINFATEWPSAPLIEVFNGRPFSSANTCSRRPVSALLRVEDGSPGRVAGLEQRSTYWYRVTAGTENPKDRPAVVSGSSSPASATRPSTWSLSTSISRGTRGTRSSSPGRRRMGHLFLRVREGGGDRAGWSPPAGQGLRDRAARRPARPSVRRGRPSSSRGRPTTCVSGRRSTRTTSRTWTSASPAAPPPAPSTTWRCPQWPSAGRVTAGSGIRAGRRDPGRLHEHQ